VQYIDADDDAELIAKEGFLEWADEEGFLPLWELQTEFGGGEPGPSLDAALQIFVNPSARSRVGLLLLSEASKSEVLEYINEGFGIPIGPDALRLYIDIFWDVTIPGRKGWGDFVADLTHPDDRHYISLGLDSPSVADARRFLEQEMGFTPEQIISRILSKAHSQFESAMDQPHPEDAGAMRWAELALRAITAQGVHKKAFGGDEAGELTPSEFQNMFSVSIEKVQHVSLAELQGEVAPKTDVPDTGAKKEE
jgi:hypothetical protein